MKPCSVTLFTSSKTLAKVWKLGEKGPEKTTAAQMVEGTYAEHTVRSMHELVALLSSVRTDQALCASLPLDGSTSGNVVTKKRVSAKPGSLSRSKDCFGFKAGVPVLVTLDYDPYDVALTKDELWAILKEVCPALAATGVVWWCSGSSCIFNGDAEVHGVRGQRFYFIARDGADVERFGRDLDRRLWLQGYGRIEVSSSGSLLRRSLFDTAMFQPARLDLIGAAECHPPLSQRRGDPEILIEGSDWLDTRSAIPPLTKEEEDRYQALLQQAKDGQRQVVVQRSAAHRSKTIQDQVPSLMKEEGITAAEAEERIGASVDAAYAGMLTGDFILYVVHDDDTIERVSVSQALSQRKRYDGMDCLVPLNEGHRNGSPDARLFLNSASPILFSFDEGGQVFRLRHQKQHINTSKGNRGELVDELSSFLARQDDVYVTDAGPVRLIDGRMTSLTKQQIQNLAGQRVVLLTRGSGGKSFPVDLAGEPAELVLANMRVAASELGMKRLTQVHSLPCVTSSGRLLATCGWDAETCVYFDLPFDYRAQVPLRPTDDAVRRALVVMASPFRAYRWATPADAAGIMSGVLTAVCRPFLRVAPMFIIDASTMGSGKTKAAIALGSLLTGRYEGITPFSGLNDEELRKRIMAGVLEGVRFHCLDNLVGHVKSATLSGVLTSGRLSDRKLGVTGNVEGECRALMTGTANNVSLEADILRRTVRVRIDSGVRPTERSFDFDPCDVALRDRMAIAEAACTLLMAYFNDGSPAMTQDDAGGFADWSKMCRHPLLWAQRKGLTDLLGWHLTDPATSMMVKAEQLDPELSTLEGFLRAVHALTGGARFTAKDVVDWFRLGDGAAANDATFDVRETLSEWLPGRRDVSSRTIGSVLVNRHDRHVGGLVLRQRFDRSANSNSFVIELSDAG